MKPPSGRVSRWVQATGIAGTVFLGISAFWLSYRSLTRLAEMSGIHDPWLWPLIVDGIIVVATVSAVAMAGRYGAWYPWLLLVCGAVVSVTANAIQAAMTPNLAVPHALAATAASIPPIVLLAVTHLTVVLSRPAEFKPSKKRKHVTPPVEATPPIPTPVPPPMPPAPSEEWAAPPPSATAPPPVWTPPPPPAKTGEPAPEPEQEITGQARDDEQAPDAARADDGVTEHDAAEDTDAMADDALRALIADIRRDTGTEAAGPVRGTSRTSLMAQASGLKAEGMSNKEIGQRLGVDPTTIGRWLRQLANGASNA